MFGLLGTFAYRYPRIVIGIWVLLAIVAGAFALRVEHLLKAGGFEDPRGEATLATAALQRAFPSENPQKLLVVLEATTPTTLNALSGAVVRVQEVARAFPEIVRISTYQDPGNANWLSDDGAATLIYLGLNTSDNVAQNLVPRLTERLETADLGGVEFQITGAPALDYALNVTSKKDVVRAEMIGFPIMIVILLLVFRSVVAAVVPLIMAGLSIVTTMAIGYFVARATPLSILFTNAISMIGLAVAVDYALFIIKRFREELGRHPLDKALVITMETAGHSVFFSGATVLISLLALLIPRIMVFTTIALGGSIVVLSAMAISLTLLPAILRLLGYRINAGSWGTSDARSSSFWYVFSQRLMRRPLLFLIPALLFMLILAWPAFQINMRVPVASADILPSGEPARTGLEILNRRFKLGSLFPLQVLVETDKGVNPVEVTVALQTLAENIARDPAVSQVTGLPTLGLPTPAQVASLAGQFDVLPAEARPFIQDLVAVNGGAVTTRLIVAPRESPDSRAVHDLVSRLRAEQSSMPSGVRLRVAGEAAKGLDFDRAVFHSLPAVVGMVFLITLIVLVVTFRSIAVPIKAIVLNTLVAAASIGVMVLLFQQGAIFGWESRGAINTVTPILLFSILFGLSMDYEVFILSRVRELFDEGLSNTEAVAQGISETAGVITGGAAIMFGVFGSFSLAKIGVVRELGFGLALAVLLDATLVRSVLVPTTMRLLGALNWYLPFGKVRSPQRRSEVVDGEVIVRSNSL